MSSPVESLLRRWAADETAVAQLLPIVTDRPVPREPESTAWPLPDDEGIGLWRSWSEEASQRGAATVLGSRLPRLRGPGGGISLARMGEVQIFVHEGALGATPLLRFLERDDFERVTLAVADRAEAVAPRAWIVDAVPAGDGIAAHPRHALVGPGPGQHRSGSGSVDYSLEVRVQQLAARFFQRRLFGDRPARPLDLVLADAWALLHCTGRYDLSQAAGLLGLTVREPGYLGSRLQATAGARDLGLLACRLLQRLVHESISEVGRSFSPVVDAARPAALAEWTSRNLAEVALGPAALAAEADSEDALEDTVSISRDRVEEAESRAAVESEAESEGETGAGAEETVRLELGEKTDEAGRAATDDTVQLDVSQTIEQAEDSEASTEDTQPLERRLAVAANPQAVERVTRFAEEFCRLSDLDRAIAFRLQVVLDELVSNLVKYGYPNGGTGTLVVALTRDGDEVHCELVDDGRAFDPTAAEAPDTEAVLEDRPIGGLGVFLVGRMAREMSYERSGRNNHVRIVLDARSIDAEADA